MSCSFCKGKNKIVDMKCNHQNDFTAEIEEYRIKIHMLVSEGSSVYPDYYKDFYIPINFCPICGERIGGK